MDDIWDDDAVEIARPAPKSTAKGASRSRMLPSDSDDDQAASGSRPSKRARTDKPLFNPDSDDEELPPAPGKDGELPPEIDALFDGLDDDDFVIGLPPQLDTAQLQQEADRRAAVEAARKRLARGETDVLGERIDEGGKSGAAEKPAKPKRVIPKLDETRLLDRDGLPALVRQVKEFNIKGKGHELSDLNRLMQVYQLWAHKMFPKMQFHDTVERVERLCRSRRMHVALSTWRDMQNPPASGEAEMDAETGDGMDGASGEEHDQTTAQHPPTSSPARITLEPGGPSVRQSQAHVEPDEDEEEMWRDMMEAVGSQNQAKQKNTGAAPTAPSRKEPEDQFGGYDEEDWAIMDEMEKQLDPGKPPGGDQSTITRSAQRAESSGPDSPPGPDHDVSSDAPPDPSGPSEDEDDFYAMYEP
ncbi:hypothetical protein FRC10_006796 [Ceratobasidium sp. 414]|nr:hypothetical protein FRC10_006796 [Ceratobasidium sp. 414]